MNSFTQENSIKKSLEDFFKALKFGDTSALLQQMQINGRMYKQRYNALQNNKTKYSEQLKSRYKNARFSIHEIKPIEGGDIIADIVISFPDGSNISRQITMNKDTDSNLWKIVDDKRSSMKF